VADVTGLLFAVFYILTALAAIVYYWNRVTASAPDALILGILPAAAAAFLAWILVKSLLAAPAAQIWSMAGIIAAGLVLMLYARFVLQSPFFVARGERFAGAARGRIASHLDPSCFFLRWRGN
jgi:hypothetical protein